MSAKDLKFASCLRIGSLLMRQPDRLESSAESDIADNLDALRVCFLDWAAGLVGLINLKATKSLGYLETLEEIDARLASGALQVATADPWLRGNPAEDLAQVHLDAAKKRYEILRPYIAAQEPQLFQRVGRDSLCREIAAASGQSAITIRAWIRAYYVGGMTTLSLLPDYQRCGAPGKPRPTGERKRGCPRVTRGMASTGEGINVDEMTAKKLHEGYKIFRVGKDKMSWRKAYLHTMARFFSDGFERNAANGEYVRRLLPAAERPTLRQFVYWAKKLNNSRTAAAHRRGSRSYEKDHRPVLGSARTGIVGPGQMYQVDATGGLVHLVSKENRKILINKAVVYVVVDTYSHLVVGFATSLEHASYTALMPALAHAFAPKDTSTQTCAESFAHDDWPGGVVCETLLTDRGAEFLSKDLETAALTLGFDIAHAPPGRPDLKPLAERAFGYLKDCLRGLPGAAKELNERGRRDPRKDACLTLDEFNVTVATIFQSLNHTREIANHPDALKLTAEGILPTPFNLWNYGIREKSGRGRLYPADDIKLALLPRATAVATPAGLSWKGLEYQSTSLAEQGAFYRGTGHKRLRYSVAYDPRNISELMLLNSAGAIIERCKFTAKFAHLNGISLWEWEARQRHVKGIRAASEDHVARLTLDADQAVKDTVAGARAKKKKSGAAEPEFMLAAQTAEKAERRRESAWVGAQSKSANPPPGNGYVPMPSLTEDLDSDEENT